MSRIAGVSSLSFCRFWPPSPSLMTLCATTQLIPREEGSNLKMVIKELLPANRPKHDFQSPDEFEDCTSCRIIGKSSLSLLLPHTDFHEGSTALVSLGGYTYFSGMKQLKLQRKAIEMSKSRYKYGSRQLGIVTLSATFFSMGIYRMLN